MGLTGGLASGTAGIILLLFAVVVGALVGAMARDTAAIDGGARAVATSGFDSSGGAGPWLVGATGAGVVDWLLVLSARGPVGGCSTTAGLWRTAFGSGMRLGAAPGGPGF